MSSTGDPRGAGGAWRRVAAAFRQALLATRGETHPAALPDLNRLQRLLVANLRVLFMVFRLDIYNRVELHAQALTMKTLLSLVPLFVVILAVVSAFGGGVEDANQRLIDLGLRYLSGSEELQSALRAYIHQSGIQEAELGAFSVGVLVVTVMSLLGHVERSVNTLFGVTAARPLGVRLLSYWALVTLGPLLLLSSIALSAALQTSWFAELVASLGVVGRWAVSATPLLITWVAFAVLYLGVPNTRVKLGPAVLAAVVTGSLWNIAKYLFGWYAANNVTMQDLYGSLATLPMFILWVYISWVLVLAGAHLCFASQHAATYQPTETTHRITHAELVRTACALAVEVARDFHRGAPAPDPATLGERLGTSGMVTEVALEHLRGGGYVVTTPTGGLVPGRDTERTTLAELLAYLDHTRVDGVGAAGPTAPLPEGAPAPRPPRAAPGIASADELPLPDLLQAMEAQRWALGGTSLRALAERPPS